MSVSGETNAGGSRRDSTQRPYRRLLLLTFAAALAIGIGAGGGVGGAVPQSVFDGDTAVTGLEGDVGTNPTGSGPQGEPTGATDDGNGSTADGANSSDEERRPGPLSISDGTTTVDVLVGEVPAYGPGETVPIWFGAVDESGDVPDPVPGVSATLTVALPTVGDSEPLETFTLETDESGYDVAEFDVPADFRDERIEAELEWNGETTTASFWTGRTVESGDETFRDRLVGQDVTATARVTDGGAPVENDPIDLEVSREGTLVANDTVTTDEHGVASIEFVPHAPGTYSLSVDENWTIISPTVAIFDVSSHAAVIADEVGDQRADEPAVIAGHLRNGTGRVADTALDVRLNGTATDEVEFDAQTQTDEDGWFRVEWTDPNPGDYFVEGVVDGEEASLPLTDYVSIEAAPAAEAAAAASDASLTAIVGDSSEPYGAGATVPVEVIGEDAGGEGLAGETVELFAHLQEDDYSPQSIVPLAREQVQLDESGSAELAVDLPENAPEGAAVGVEATVTIDGTVVSDGDDAALAEWDLETVSAPTYTAGEPAEIELATVDAFDEGQAGIPVTVLLIDEYTDATVGHDGGVTDADGRVTLAPTVPADAERLRMVALHRYFDAGSSASGGDDLRRAAGAVDGDGVQIEGLSGRVAPGEAVQVSYETDGGAATGLLHTRIEGERTVSVADVDAGEATAIEVPQDADGERLELVVRAVDDAGNYYERTETAEIVDPHAVTGTVVDAATGDGVAATVSLVTNDSADEVDTVTANADGTFDLRAFEEGRYDLLIQAEGYEPASIVDVNVAGEETAVGTVELEALPVLVSVDSTNAPVTEGETLTVTATVENAASDATSEMVELLDVNGSVLDSTEVALAAGETTSVDLTWETDDGDAGSHSLTVGSAADADSVQVEVERLIPAAFEVAVDSTNSPVAAGETVAIEATVENTGGESGRETVTLGGPKIGTLDATDVTLDPGETTTVDLAWTTAESDVGTYRLLVATSDDQAEAPVAVQADDLDVRVTPSTPTTLDTVTLYAADATNPRWEFEDGTTARGQLVFHSFPFYGTETVEVTDVDGTTETVEIDVTMPVLSYEDFAQPVLSFSSIEREYGGTPLSGVTWEEEFSISTTGNVAVDRVEFELDGETRVDDSPTGDDQVATATFDLGELDGDAELTATVIDDDGGEVEHTEMVSVNEPPSWLAEALEDHARVDREAGTIETELDAGQLAESFDLDIPVDVGEQSLGGAPAAVVTYDAGAPAATVDGDGEFSSGLLGTTVTAGTEVEGALDANLALQSARLAAYGEVSGVPGPKLGIDAPYVGEVGVGTTLDARLGADGEFDDELAFEEGTLGGGADVAVRVALDLGCELFTEGSGGADVVFDIPDEPDTRGEARVGVGAGVDCSLFELYEDLEYAHEFNGGVGDSPLENLALTTVDEDPFAGAEWELASAEGERPFAGEDAAVAATSGPAAVPGAATRLTARDREDTEPAIAAVGEDLVVVWSALDDEKNVTDGRDLRTRTYDADGGAWTETASLTDDLTSDEAPALAARGDAVLAGWSTLNETVDADAVAGPADTFPAYEIAYAIDRGDGWSDSAVLTDTDNRQHRPSAVATDDGWLLAWESVELAGENLTGSDVRYAIVEDDGTATAVETIENATLPALGLDDGTPTLAYATRDGDRIVEVVTESVEGGARTELHRYDATDATAVATADGRTVWVNGTVESRLFEGDVDGVAELDLREDVHHVSELALETADGETLLSYRAGTEDAAGDALVYRLDRGDGWIRDRAHATVDDANHTAWHADLAAATDGEGFHAAYAVRKLEGDAVNDVFVSDHAFRPAFDLMATATDAAAGERSTVSYDLRNVGDRETAEGVTVLIENETGIVGERSHDPVGAGDTVSGSVEATVDDSGMFEVRIDHDEETHEGTESTTAVAATPALYPEAVETTREGDAVTVDVAVRNDGGAVATDVPIALENGTDRVGGATVDRIDPGANATTSVTVPLSVANRTVPDRVRLDPDGTLADGAIETAERAVWFLQPDLDVGDVAYVHANGTVTAEVLLANRGTGTANATVRVADPTGSVLGEAEATVDNASAVSPTFATVPVDLGDVEEGTAVTVTANSEVPDATPATAGAGDTVGPLLTTDRPHFEVAIAAVGGSVEAGDDLDVDIAVENLGEEFDEQTIALFADGTEVERIDVALEPGFGMNETVTVPTAAGDVPSIDLRTRSETAHDAMTVPIEPSADVPAGGGGGGGGAPAPVPVDDPATFAITSLDAPAEADATEAATVSATIRNDGDERGTTTVELRVDGAVIDAESVALDGGASRTVEFRLPAGTLDPGEHTLVLDAGDDQETTTLGATQGDGGEAGSEGGGTADGSDGTPEEDGDDGDGLPGFGIPVALAAFVAVGLWWVRTSHD